MTQRFNLILSKILTAFIYRTTINNYNLSLEMEEIDNSQNNPSQQEEGRRHYNPRLQSELITKPQ